MNIVPSQSTLQAFGNTLASPAPATQTNVSGGAQTSAPPTPNSTQRTDAVARTETTDRPAPTSAPDRRDAAKPSPPPESQRATKVDIIV